MSEPRTEWNISYVQKCSVNPAAALHILSELFQQSPLDLLVWPLLCSASAFSCSIRSPAALSRLYDAPV